MDHVAQLNPRGGRGIAGFLLLALLLVPAGCHRGWHGGAIPPPGPEEPARDNTTPAAVAGWPPPAVVEKIEEVPPGSPAADNIAVVIVATDNAAANGSATDNAAIDAPRIDGQGGPSAGEGRDASGISGHPADGQGGPSAGEGMDAAGISEHPADVKGRPGAGAGREAAGSAAPVRKPKTAAAPLPAPVSPPKDARGAVCPGWAKSPEELVYRVDFIGITMGYARFRYKGKVTIGGKVAYHLNVRAWTSGVLSYIFPINETIDYYLDTESLAPIRQEFTQREREKDDVAHYNQETGRITYRYRQTGKIRKEVDTVPSVYDPVSVAYYFRWRDLGIEDRPRNVYAGRKLYQISSRFLGNERIHTPNGEVNTIAILPVIRRNGKPDNKGDLKIWFSSDERHVPVRLYAKFHKIKDWTLVGELMPSNAKAGG